MNCLTDEEIKEFVRNQKKYHEMREHIISCSICKDKVIPYLESFIAQTLLDLEKDFAERKIELRRKGDSDLTARLFISGVIVGALFTAFLTAIIF